MGRMFGRYELRERIGSGGMGVVFRAHDTRLNRRVALKLISAQLADDSDFARRFRRECEIITALDHEHIVPIYDYGEIDGELYVAMRLLEGHDLGQLLADGPLPPSTAVDIVTQVATALDATHSRGVLHRDVKPKNIFVTRLSPEPFAYLLDFGIAVRTGSTTITSHDSVIGSWPYMAPERFDQRATVGPPSDEYALGCVLFEMLTGRPAFPQSEPLSIMNAHLSLPPPRVGASTGGAPAALDEVIATALAKRPEERFGSSTALATAARAAIGSGARESATTRVPSFPIGATAPLTKQLPRRRHRARWLAAAGVLAVAGAAGIAAFATAGGTPSADRTPPPSQTSSSASPAGTAGATSPITGASAASTPGPTGELAAVGDCLTTGGGRTPCAAPHTLEIYAVSSSCSFARLLAYLGGTPDHDTLLPSVRGVEQTDNGRPACAVQGPSATTSGSARGILLDPRGDGWRRCYDAPTSRTLGCDQPHTLEYVDTTSGTAALDCAVQASTYMDAPVTNYSADLRVERLTGGGGQACVVETTTDGNVLTASVHHLSFDSLPVAPRR